MGTAGVDYQVATSPVYFGTNSLQLIQGTAVNTSWEQSFGAAVANYSTSAKLEGGVQYAGCFRVRSTGALPTTGVITIELLNSAGTVLADDQAANNSDTLSLPGVILAVDTWYTKTFVFRTPKNIAAGAKLRFRLSTVLANSAVYVDGMAFGRMHECYPGGPFVAPIAGSTPFVRADDYQDHWTIAVTNTNGGAASARATYHRLLDALFDLRVNGILLPTLVANNVLDSDIA